MGPIWILVIIVGAFGRAGAEVSVEEFATDAEALAAYEKAIAKPYRDIYLGPVAREAHK